MQPKEWTPEEIRGFRKSRHMVQRELAQMLGVTERYVIYLEKGVRKPSTMLCLFLDCLEREKTKRERR